MFYKKNFSSKTHLHCVKCIVFIWSQYDGGNIDKEQWLRFPPKPNEAKLNIMGGDLFWILTSNILIQSFTI